MRSLALSLLLALCFAACGGGDDRGGSLDLVPAGTSATLTITAATPGPTLASTTPGAASQPGRVTLAAVGDVMLARAVGAQVLESGPATVFAGIDGLLARADVAVANLETAIGVGGTPAAKGYTFQAPPETVAALRAGGIDVVSQANNHALDYGPAALLETRSLLGEIAVVGAGADAAEARRAAIIKSKGLTIAFLGYVDTAAEGAYSRAAWEATADSPGVAWADTSLIAEDVAAARALADLVIVVLHAGVEYDVQPAPDQQAYAEAAIDAGAALVLGSHPHVLQPVEEYGGGLIVFSLGNFVFDGFDGSANDTAIVRAELTADGVATWEMTPVRIVGGLPELVE